MGFMGQAELDFEHEKMTTSMLGCFWLFNPASPH